MLAYAHGTTGIDVECGPSLFANLLGTTGQIAGFLKAGFAVAAADYEGLGAPGIHLYLDAKAEAWNVIDSVRALRQLRPGSISERWLAFGGSQGGGASWAAAEQAVSYAPELQLLGAVAIVPAADISGIAQMALDGSMNPWQMGAYIGILTAQSRAYSALELDQYRRGSVAANWRALTYCDGPHAPEWTRAAIARACAMGSKIDVVFQPEQSHGTFDASGVPEWIARRLANEPFKGSCE